MMNIPPSDAAKLSLEEYESLLWHWNEAHRSEDDIEPPDPETTVARLAAINADPRLTT